jgi:hypothetical protein
MRTVLPLGRTSTDLPATGEDVAHVGEPDVLVEKDVVKDADLHAHLVLRPPLTPSQEMRDWKTGVFIITSKIIYFTFQLYANMTSRAAYFF